METLRIASVPSEFEISTSLIRVYGSTSRLIRSVECAHEYLFPLICTFDGTADMSLDYWGRHISIREEAALRD